MGKKQISKKQIEKKNNSKFNLIRRNAALHGLDGVIIFLTNKYTLDEVIESIAAIKDKLYDMDTRDCVVQINKCEFIKTIDLIQEFYIVISGGGTFQLLDVEHMARSLISGYTKETYISCMLYIQYVSNYLSDEFNGDLKYTSMLDAASILSEYASTFISPILNYEIKDVTIDKDNVVKLKYSSIEIFDSSQLDSLYHTFNTRSSFKSRNRDQYIDKLGHQYHSIYNKVFFRNIDSDFISHDELADKKFLKIQHSYIFPLYKEDDFILSEEEMCKIPNNRLYAQPASGVRFDFIKDDICIDYIDFKETENEYLFKVHLFNDGEMMACDTDENQMDIIANTEYKDMRTNKDAKDSIVNKRYITEKKVTLLFIVNKKSLESADLYEDKLKLIECINYCISNDEPTMNFFKYLYNIVLGCVYVAYYNPSLFADEMKLYKKTVNKEHGYTRISTYRVAHLKRLGIGQHATKQAKQYASEAGFFIPEGFTFVREFNGVETGKQKVIQIDA